MKEQGYKEKGWTDRIISFIILSFSYLTGLFKQYVGYSVLEYIQRVRVARAKEYLESCTIKEAAEKSGFWDSQALTRTFKKYEGMTPGAYKEKLKTSAE